MLNRIPKACFTNVVRNILFGMKKTGIYDINALINLENKISQNPEAVLSSLIGMLKESRKRITKPLTFGINKENRGENNNDNI